MHIRSLKTKEPNGEAHNVRRLSFALCVDCPFARAHHGFKGTVLFDAINIHLRRADHEIHVVEADVASSRDKFFIGQFFTSDEREAVRASNGDVTGSVLVEEGVVEKMSALGNGGTG